VQAKVTLTNIDDQVIKKTIYKQNFHLEFTGERMQMIDEGIDKITASRRIRSRRDPRGKTIGRTRDKKNRYALDGEQSRKKCKSDSNRLLRKHRSFARIVPANIQRKAK